jgi:hypothetical protein
MDTQSENEMKMVSKLNWEIATKWENIIRNRPVDQETPSQCA